MKKYLEFFIFILMGMMLAGLIFLDRFTIGGVLCGFLVLLLFYISEKRRNPMLTGFACLCVLAWSWHFFEDLMAIGACMNMGNKMGILNFLMYLSLLFLFSVLFKNPVQGLVIPTVLLYLLGLTNGVIKEIRSTPLSAGDFFSIGTAMTVAGNYRLVFPMDFFIKTTIALAVSVGTLFLTFKRLRLLTFRGKVRILTGGISLGLFFFLTFSTLPQVWTSARADYWSHETNGFAWNLCLQARELSNRKPEGYELAELLETAQRYQREGLDSIQGDQDSSYPTIIAVMNESFSDLSVLGKLETKEDPLPNLRKIKEESISGNVVVSVYGGNTANSEYEFLTGDSMAAYSERVVPYQLYIHGFVDTLFSQLESLGYKSMFVHPYGAYGWNRPSVYGYFGVDQLFFQEDLQNLTFLREFATDESQYENVLTLLNNKEKNQPLFLFDVTVQNHGGYQEKAWDLQREVVLSGDFKETQNYLNLLAESDRALGVFLEQLKEYEEPVYVIFFGDHQPAVEKKFVEGMLQNSLGELTTAEKQRLYTLPYLIWCNQGVEPEKTKDFSLNYLSAFALEKIGIPLTPYQSYLMELCQRYPVINTVGIRDSFGKDFSWEELTEEQKKDLRIYKGLIYHHIFDQDALPGFFGGQQSSE